MSKPTPPFRADVVGSFLRPDDRQGGAQGAFRGQDHVRRRASCYRGRGDPGRHQDAGRCRPAGSHRWRVPPCLVAFRFHGHAQWSRYRTPRIRRHPVPWRHDPCRRAGDHWQARFPGRPSDAGALQVRCPEHQGDAENLNSRPERGAFPYRPGRHLVADYKNDAEAYFADITATYKKAVEAFYAAGCRYLQMDDIFFAYLCDPEDPGRAQGKGRGSGLADLALCPDDA